MAILDAHVREVARYVAAAQSAGQTVRHFTAPSSPRELAVGLPVRVGPGANRGIILRSDTFVELGSPEAGSCALGLWTDAPSLLVDGRITLIGPDIPEAPHASLPFGQVVMAGGAALGVEASLALGQAQIVADQIEGYMVRSSSHNLWSRVSHDAARRGFRFETLGWALMLLCKSSVATVETMEVVFVTSSKDDVLQLNELAAPVRERERAMLKEHWKARGYDLDCDLHCGSCSDKSVCDDIQKMLAARLRAEKESARARIPYGQTNHRVTENTEAKT
jgi:CO dehydrogenase/acetyl-CoA synthase beta subunit